MSSLPFTITTASFSNITNNSTTVPWTYYQGTTATSATGAQQLHLVPAVPDRLLAEKRTIELPDGAKLLIDAQGNYRIEDKDAKVTYHANRMRDWSPHLNASDMLADFVSYVGRLGLKRKEVLKLPIDLFISWLIIEAAERDKDPVPAEVVPIAKRPEIVAARKPRCLGCGRFIPIRHHASRFPFCRPEHAARLLEAGRFDAEAR